MSHLAGYNLWSQLPGMEKRTEKKSCELTLSSFNRKLMMIRKLTANRTKVMRLQCDLLVILSVQARFRNCANIKEKGGEKTAILHSTL